MRNAERTAVVFSAAIFVFGAGGARAQSKRPVAMFPGLSQPVSLDTAGALWKGKIDPAVAFGRLRALYAEMKVPLSVDDSVTGIIGNLRLVKSRTLGGKPMSNWLNCGGDVSGPLANTGRVTLALVSLVIPQGDSTAIRTALIAAAQSMEGAQRDAVSCYTSGQLEQQMFKRVMDPSYKR